MAHTDAGAFLEYCSLAFSWGTLSGKTAMDIGCATGSNSTRRFIELFPAVGKLIGLDENESFIEEARDLNRHPCIEYHVADIQQWSQVEQWEGQIDVIISHYCFNCFPDLQKGFESVFKLLAPGGTAGVLFTIESDIHEWVKEVGEKYHEYAPDIDFQPPSAHAQRISASYYEPLLQEMGFEVVQCIDDPQSWDFRITNDFKNYLGDYCPISTRIPSEMRESYMEDVFEIFKKHSPVNERGMLDFKCRNAKILIRKN